MIRHAEIVVLGASAGGVRPLARVLELLPKDLDAAFFVATHRSSPHTLVDIFRGRSRLAVEEACDGTKFERATIYVCPGDFHLSVEHGRMRVEHSPREWAYRPSINVLFRSAAAAYGHRVAGVLLSGNQDDGVAGLWEIRRRGGIAIVQDPLEAQSPSMPQSAIDNLTVDYVLPVEEIATILTALTRTPPARSHSPVKVLIVEDETIVADDMGEMLQQRGYHVSGKVRTARSAIMAIAAESPNVILMDIRLEGTLSGTEAARIIWERFQIPVVYLTAYGDPQTLDEVKTSGGYGFVMKPFRPEAVQAAIDLALVRREGELAF